MGPDVGRKEPFVRDTICSDAKYLRIRRDDAAFNSMHHHATTIYYIFCRILHPVLFATVHKVHLKEILHDSWCLLFRHIFDPVCTYFIFVNCFEITATFHFSSFWIHSSKMPDGNSLPCCWKCRGTFHQPAYCNNDDNAVTQVWTVFTLRLASHFRDSVGSFFLTECGGCDTGASEEVC